MKVPALVSLVVLSLALHVPDATAQADEALTDYTLASWTTRDGLPSNFVAAVAQDAAGYLWIGTSSGLTRFDGIRFETADAVGRVAVSALLVARDDTLWIGFRQGRGIARLQRGQLRWYGSADGVAGAVMTGFVEESGGQVWAASDSGLFRLTGGRWAPVGAAQAFPDAPVLSLRLARDGAVIAGTSIGLYRLPAGTDRFERVDTFNDGGRGILDIAEDSTGRLWVPDVDTGMRPLGGMWPDRGAVDRARGNRVLVDHLGNLWVGTTAALLRVRVASGETSVAPIGVFGGRCLFEDRDGNVWVGTVEGLFRLSTRRLSAVGNIGLISAVEATPDGSVWVVSSEGLLRYPPSPAPLRAERVAIPGGRPRAMHADRAGALWLATAAGLVRLVEGRVREVAPLGGIAPDDVATLIPADDGRVWISTRSRGLLTWRSGRVETVPVPGLTSASVALLAVDRTGRVWLRPEAERIVVLEPDGRMRSFGSPDGLGAGPYNVAYEDSGGAIWIGGSEGVSRFVDGRFVMLRLSIGPQTVSAVMENDDGDLWLGTSEGLAVIERELLDDATTSPISVTQAGLYDVSDGLAGLTGNWGVPNAARGRDGRLWFVTGRGISIVNPLVLKTRRKPVTVRIERVSVDDRPVDTAAAPARLSGGIGRVAIDYAAIELTAPQKVRYRYMLEGFDAEWIEAGARRAALYTDLPARQYTFRVDATKLETPWERSEASWVFSVTPPFYQTRWFAAVMALTVIAATWGFWQLRLHRSRRQFALLLAERVRMSHELHDTLLQSLVGTAWQFEAIASRLEQSSSVRQQLTALRRQVDQHIHEARESIWNLRSPATQSGDLAAALRESCERTLEGVHDRIAFSVTGTPYRCDPDVEQQLLRIGHEALLNAARHAAAGQIRAEVEYRPDRIALSVSDDGRGFDVDEVRRRQNGHLGLVTMQERASEVGAEFRLDSTVGRGTRIHVVAPARRAQADAS